MKHSFYLGFLFLGSIVTIAACSDSTTSSTNTGGGGAGGEATTSSSSSSTSNSSSSSSSSNSSSSSGSSSSSSSSSGGGSTDHLVISEIGVQPAGGEFIEIYNAGSAAVDLSNYYISDNSVYHGIAAGTAWTPATSTAGTDFLAQFPMGTMIAPGATIVIASDKTFETTFMKCPDFILSTTPATCANGMAKAMVAPTNGGIGDKAGALLSNDREMVVLFQWDGSSATVKDVDYVVWGTTFDDGTRIDKSGVAGYQPDTPRAEQKPATAPTTNATSIERCALELGESQSGGNGISGHNETSEPLGVNFVVQPSPTPNVKNACLP